MKKTPLILIEAIAIIVGTIIGAGVFTLPYVAEYSGMSIFLFWLIIVTMIITFLHLLYGEVVLRTPKEFRLPGYAGYYLGAKAKRFILVTTFLTFSFSLLIYLILGGDFLRVILGFLFPGVDIPSGLLTIILWLVFSLFIVNANQKITAINFYLSFLLLIIFLVISFQALPHFSFSQINWLHFNNHWGWLLPYGVIFFAVNGMVAIPEAAKIIKRRKLESKLKRIIIIGTLIPVICYLLFVLSVVGVSGEHTSRDAISGLIGVLGKPIVFLGALLGFLAVATSYLIFADYIKNSFIYDFKWTPFISYLVVVLGPLVLYLSNFANIIKLMSFIGGLLGGLEGIMLVLIAEKAKKSSSVTPNYRVPLDKKIAAILIVALLVGALCQTFLVY